MVKLFLTLIIIGNVAVSIFVHKVFLESFSYYHNIKYKAFEKVQRGLQFCRSTPITLSKAGLY